MKEIFPPRFRFRKLLITIRLSAISFAGTARTEVAVGTSSEDVMFFTTAAATPRNGVVVMPAPSASCAALAAFAAFAATMSPGVAVVVGRAGRATGGDESVDSLPPTRAGAAGGDAATGLVDLRRVGRCRLLRRRRAGRGRSRSGGRRWWRWAGRWTC